MPTGLKTAEWTSAKGELHRQSYTFEDGVNFCLNFSAHPNPLDDDGVVEFANETTVEAQRPGEKAHTKGCREASKQEDRTYTAHFPAAAAGTTASGPAGRGGRGGPSPPAADANPVRRPGRAQPTPGNGVGGAGVSGGPPLGPGGGALPYAAAAAGPGGGVGGGPASQMEVGGIPVNSMRVPPEV